MAPCVGMAVPFPRSGNTLVSAAAMPWPNGFFASDRHAPWCACVFILSAASIGLN